MVAVEDHRLLDAFSAWEELSQTPESIIAYESRLKKIIDDEAKIDYARYQGREEGREEGRTKGKVEGKIDVILQGAKNGLSITTLAQITGFSEERVEEILKNEEQ